MTWDADDNALKSAIGRSDHVWVIAAYREVQKERDEEIKRRKVLTDGLKTMIVRVEMDERYALMKGWTPGQVLRYVRASIVDDVVDQRIPGDAPAREADRDLTRKAIKTLLDIPVQEPTTHSSGEEAMAQVLYLVLKADGADGYALQRILNRTAELAKEPVVDPDELENDE